MLTLSVRKDTKAGDYQSSGLSFTVPKNTMAIIEVSAIYASTRPSGVAISGSDDNISDSFLYRKYEGYPTNIMFIPDVQTFDKTYYVWAKYEKAGENIINMRGFFIKQ